MTIHPALPQSRHLPARRVFLTRRHHGHFNRRPPKSSVTSESIFQSRMPDCIKPTLARVEGQDKSLFSPFGRYGGVLRFMCPDERTAALTAAVKLTRDSGNQECYEMDSSVSSAHERNATAS